MPIVTRRKGNEDKDYRNVYVQLGCIFSQLTGDEAIADDCPFCLNDRFFVNITTGQYHCKHCSEEGNVTTFLTWYHNESLKRTTDKYYHALKAKRGIALQTLKRHQLAYDPEGQRWLIPFKATTGSVVNIQSYYPNQGKPNKYNLPVLPTSIYGLDQLSSDQDKILFLCEGPFDAIALDYHLGDKRDKYDIVATPGGFKECWTEFFRNRKVRALYHNDKGGDAHREQVRKYLGETRVAKELRLLHWPDSVEIDGQEVQLPKQYDINDLVRDPQFKGLSLTAFTLAHSVKVTAEKRLIVYHGRQKAAADRKIDWVWPDHLRCGTYVSFSGRQGTFKSTIAKYLAARYSRGLPMPMCDEAGMPAGHVLFLYAEENLDEVEAGFEQAGGDFEKWHAMPAQGKDGDPLNVLDHLVEMEEIIREYGIRFVIIDGQNSVVGAPNIGTDMQARHNVTNKLHQFAQRLNICLMGIRNEDADGRALGPQSFGDIGRCVLRAVEEERHDPPCCKLVFVKVSDAPRSAYPDIPYSVNNLGGNRREILWGESTADNLKASLAAKAQAQRCTGEGEE